MWILAENTVEQVTQGMYGVMNEPGGTGNPMKLQGIEFCGKSGTRADDELQRGEPPGHGKRQE